MSSRWSIESTSCVGTIRICTASLENVNPSLSSIEKLYQLSVQISQVPFVRRVSLRSRIITCLTSSLLSHGLDIDEIGWLNMCPEHGRSLEAELLMIFEEHHDQEI